MHNLSFNSRILLSRIMLYNRRCSACGCAMFCDRECQRLAWKDHKFECRAIRRSNGNVPDIEVRLLGRIVIRHKVLLPL